MGPGFEILIFFSGSEPIRIPDVEFSKIYLIIADQNIEISNIFRIGVNTVLKYLIKNDIFKNYGFGFR